MKAKTFVFPVLNYDVALEYIGGKLATARYVEGPLYYSDETGDFFALFYNDGTIHCVDFNKVPAEMVVDEAESAVAADIPADAKKKLESVRKQLYTYYRRNQIPKFIAITHVEQARKLLAPKERHIWKSLARYPAPNRELVLLFDGSGVGRFGLGYFDDGKQMESSGQECGWKAHFWTEIPGGPNALIGNYLE